MDIPIRPASKRTPCDISQAGIRCNAIESKLRLKFIRYPKARFCLQNCDPLGSDDHIRRAWLIDKKKVGVVGDLLLRYGASFCGKFNLANPSAHNTSQLPDLHPRESPFDSVSLSRSDRYLSLEPWPRAIQFRVRLPPPRPLVDPSPHPRIPSTSSNRLVDRPHACCFRTYIQGALRIDPAPSKHLESPHGVSVIQLLGRNPES